MPNTPEGRSLLPYDEASRAAEAEGLAGVGATNSQTVPRVEAVPIDGAT